MSSTVQLSASPRLPWVDGAKGISILLVVALYVGHTVSIEIGQLTYFDWVIAWAKPFRMPEFFLISGLFLGYVINRPLETYIDRRVLHYLYFYFLWLIIHVSLKEGVFLGNPSGAMQSILVGLIQPYGILWFIYVLAMASAVCKLIHALRINQYIVFFAAYLLSAASMKTGYYAVDQFTEYFVFFYTGQIAGPLVLKWVEFANERKVLSAVILGAWAILNAALVFLPSYTLTPGVIKMGFAGWVPGLQTGLGLIGAIAICIFARLIVTAKWMFWLVYIGQRSLFIYVSFVLVMGIARIVLNKLNLPIFPELYVTILFVVSVSAPLLVLPVIRNIPILRIIAERPEWVSISSRPKIALYTS